MQKLLLNREWELGDPLGADAGGYGRVFKAHSAEGDQVVVKLIEKRPGAERELLFTGAGKRNVVPILDSGEHEGCWAIVMPRAEKSLRQHLVTSGGSLLLEECIKVLADIAEALQGLDGDVVHRDLKPENVLLLNGTWCLADFGIARYADAATASQTWKFAGTGAYLAPERWRMERATIASDIYSLGIMGFEMFSGTTPFTGPANEDFRRQHLHADPPRLATAPALFESLIVECLYRAPQSRPTPANVAVRLRSLLASPSAGGLAALADANRVQTMRAAREQQQESQNRSEQDRRHDLLEAATNSFGMFTGVLLAQLAAAAPGGQVGQKMGGGWTFTLGDATLRLEAPKPASPVRVARFDVIAYSTLSLRIPQDRRGYEGRSHSLWYCDAQSAECYLWFETAFMTSPLIPHSPNSEPFALPPGPEAWSAINPGMDVRQLAWPLVPLENRTPDEFISRWGNWLALAANGQLTIPGTMPERSPHGSYR